jgi:hypothetical protein
MRVSPRIPFILILTAFIAIASGAHATECLSSASAVWAAHSGSHATWRLRLPGHIGEKCWFASSSKSKAIHVDASRDAAREIRPVGATSAPAPRPGPQDTLAETERGPSAVLPKPASADDARSILIWGKPMGLDPAWQEIFTRRERGPE